MKAWVVTQEYPYEGECLFGAYATRADALAACTNELRSGFGGDWCVYEVEVGAPARYRNWDDRLGNQP
jgi:hypothetical protein